MPRRFAVQLPESFDLVHRNRWLVQYFAFRRRGPDARQVQRRVQQHRSMASGQHKTIAVRPHRVRRVIPQIFLPKFVHHRSQAHRRTRVSGICLLHSINRKRSNCIDAQLVDVLLAHNRALLAHISSCAGRRAPAGKSGFRCTGETHRVGKFYVNLHLNAELSSKRRPFAAVTSYESTLVSMVIRSAHGSGDAEPSRFRDDSDGGGRAELVPLPVLDASTAGANGTGAASAGVAAFSSGGAISRGSTGKNCACCSAHFAASPFKGLFVLYS